MSNEILPHQHWPPLPTFPDWPYEITNDDLEFFGDVMLMRGFTNLIQDAATGPLHDIPMGWSWDLHVAIAQSQCNWPHDHADTLLAQWRRERGAA